MVSIIDTSGERHRHSVLFHRSLTLQLAGASLKNIGQANQPIRRAVESDHISGLRSRDRAQKDIERKKLHQREVLANHKRTILKSSRRKNRSPGRSYIASLYSYNLAKVLLAQAIGIAEQSALQYLGEKCSWPQRPPPPPGTAERGDSRPAVTPGVGPGPARKKSRRWIVFLVIAAVLIALAIPVYRYNIVLRVYLRCGD